MQKIVQKFSSFAAADRADFKYLRSLTGEQRLEMLLELISVNDPDEATVQRSAEFILLFKTTDPQDAPKILPTSMFSSKPGLRAPSHNARRVSWYDP